MANINTMILLQAAIMSLAFSANDLYHLCSSCTYTYYRI